MEIPTQASAGAGSEPSRYLVDLVKIMTFSARFGRVNWLWAGGTAGRAREPAARADRVGFGSQLILITAAGAYGLLARMGLIDLRDAPARITGLSPPPPGSPRLAEGRWDLALRNVLEFDGGQSLRAAYVAPPIGSFATPAGGLDQELGGSKRRRECWNEPWCMQGTRSEDDPQGRVRWLCAFKRRGAPHKFAEIPVDDSDKYLWRTWWVGDGSPPRRGQPWPESTGMAGAAWRTADGATQSMEAEVPCFFLMSPRPRGSVGRFLEAAGAAAPGEGPEAAVSDASGPELRMVMHYRSMRVWTPIDKEAGPAVGARDPGRGAAAALASEGVASGGTLGRARVERAGGGGRATTPGTDPRPRDSQVSGPRDANVPAPEVSPPPLGVCFQHPGLSVAEAPPSTSHPLIRHSTLPRPASSPPAASHRLGRPRVRRRTC